MSTNIEIVSERNENGVYVVQFKTKMLAVFTYYVESHGEAYIIDPTYDIIVYREFIAKRGTTLKYVVLTHYHADFIGGHTEFKVPVVMGPGAKRPINNFEIIEIPENGNFKVGKVETRVIGTPGHTLESSCFILGDENGKQFCIFTGDTVFLKEVGRPDLAVASDITAKDLAGMLFDSILKIKALDGSLTLYPGHGSGSACGKSIGGGNFCDIKTQCELNYAFLITDRNQFIERLTKDLPAPPKYFFHDAKVNQQGMSVMYEDALKKTSNPLSVQEFERHVKEGVAVIDTRHIIEDGLIKSAHWVSMNGMICQLISRIVEPETPFLLFVEEGKQDGIIERLLRIGYLNILGYNNFSMKDWKGEHVVLNLKKYQELDPKKRSIFIDVRNKQECEEMGVLEGSLHVPLPELKKRMDEVLEFVSKHEDADLLVHCKTGVRARVAASILHNHLVQPVTVLNEVLEHISQKGVKLIPYNGK